MSKTINIKDLIEDKSKDFFNEKISLIRNELDVLEFKTQEMNVVLDWDDIWNKNFLKKD